MNETTTTPHAGIGPIELRAYRDAWREGLRFRRESNEGGPDPRPASGRADSPALYVHWRRMTTRVLTATRAAQAEGPGGYSAAGRSTARKLSAC